MWCISGDPASHIGSINQILTTHHIPSALFYPILHIYTSEILLLLNTNIIVLHKMLPLVFGILFFLFFYVLSKTVFSEKNQILLSTIAGSTFINGWYLNFTPNGLSNLYFPLLIYIILNNISQRKVGWGLVTLIMVFFYPIFHPVPTFALMLILSTFFLLNYIDKKKIFDKTTYQKNNISVYSITLVTLIFVWSITWISSFYIWKLTIINIHTLMNEGGYTQLSGAVEQINYANRYGYNVIEQILKKVGGPLVYVLIAILSFSLIYKNRDNEKSNLFLLYCPMLFILFFMVVFYFLNVGFDPLRIFVYVTIISTLFVGYTLNYLISKLRIEYTRSLALCFIGLIFILSLVWINGALTLYASPYTLEPSYQNTMSEFDGMNWIFQNQNMNLDIKGITISQYRFGELLLSHERVQKIFHSSDNLKVPYHFGYDNNSTLSAYYNKSLYLGINEKDKLIYKDLFPEMAKIRWAPEDFEKLNSDVYMNKIYSSKKFELFYLNYEGKHDIS